MGELKKHRLPKKLSIDEITRFAGAFVGAGAAVTVGGVAVIGSSGCEREATVTAPPAAEVAAAPQVASSESYAQGQAPVASAPATPQVAAGQAPAGLTQEQLNDILANLTPEQRQALGPNPTPAQIGALIAPPQADAGADGAEVDLDDPSIGLINMEEIQQAFEQAADIEAFETRINEIHQGDHVLLVRARNENNATITEAWEDLDDSGEINDQSDDLVFSMSINHGDRSARLQGHGANEYYSHAYPPQYTPPAAGGFWTGFLVANMMRPGWVYYTPPPRRVVIRNHVRAYRATPAWVAHRRANRAYYARMRHTHPRFRGAVVTVSPARRTFRYARRGHGHFRPGPPPPPRVRVNVPGPPPPPRVHVNAPRPPAPPRVRVRGPAPPRPVVTIHGGGR